MATNQLVATRATSTVTQSDDISIITVPWLLLCRNDVRRIEINDIEMATLAKKQQQQ